MVEIYRASRGYPQIFLIRRESNVVNEPAFPGLHVTPPVYVEHSQITLE